MGDVAGIVATLTESGKRLLTDAKECVFVGGLRVYVEREGDGAVVADLYKRKLIGFAGQLLSDGFAVRAALTQEQQP